MRGVHEAVFRLVDPSEQADGVARLGLGRARQERGYRGLCGVCEEGGGEEPHPAALRARAWALWGALDPKLGGLGLQSALLSSASARPVLTSAALLHFRCRCSS